MGLVNHSGGAPPRTKDRRTWALPNRIATMVLVVFGFTGALLPVVAGMNWTSTAGILGGLGAISLAICSWIRGWQQDETKNLAHYQPAQTSASEGGADIAALRKQLEQTERDVLTLQHELHSVYTESLEKASTPAEEGY